MAAVALAIGSGGALNSFETTVLLTVDETLDALRRAEQSSTDRRARSRRIETVGSLWREPERRGRPGGGGLEMGSAVTGADQKGRPVRRVIAGRQGRGNRFGRYPKRGRVSSFTVSSNPPS
jgi:hypothetical protein